MNFLIIPASSQIYNRMKLILKFGKPKKLMELEVHYDGSKPTN
jgi:hypothetical protein